MAGVKELAGVWKNIREVDLRPFIAEAQRGLKLALLGAQRDRLNILADQLGGDPSPPEKSALTPLLLVDLLPGAEVGACLAEANQADLRIFLIEVHSDASYTAWVHDWLAASQAPTIVIQEVSSQDEDLPVKLGVQRSNRARHQFIQGSVDSTDFLLAEFVPLVLQLLPDRHLALGRQFPLFRASIAQRLIQDTCFSNAAYSLSTGIAEIVPILDIPLNITDMVVLSKAQAFLVYKLGLIFGFSTRWQDYLAEFGSVLGGGFFWRQLARQLVGLIPIWGIIPKVAVAYAGTYVAGNVVLRWFLTGRKVTNAQMRVLYKEAFARGKQLARQMVTKLPRPRSKRSKQLSLPETTGVQKCPQCGKVSAADAQYCQYCATPLK